MEQTSDRNSQEFTLAVEEEALLSRKIEIAKKQVADGEFLNEEELDKEIEGWG